MRAILYPKLRPSLLLPMLGYAVAGALIAGLYGVVHDQITYSISPEYFTRLKFFQFHYADFGLPPRYFVAEIGFLATWWVGFISGWFLARVVVPACPPARVGCRISAGFAVILSCAQAGSLLGFALGLLRNPNAGFAAWQGLVAAQPPEVLLQALDQAQKVLRKQRSPARESARSGCGPAGCDL